MKKLLTTALAIIMLCTMFSGFGITSNATDRIQPKVVSDFNHTLALNSSGEVFVWGNNNNGQLGNGTTTDSEVPIKFDAFPGTVYVDIANGCDHSLALTDDGQVYAWGKNGLDQLGIGITSDDIIPPTLISAFSGITVEKIFASEFSSAAITNEGKLYVWGDIQYNYSYHNAPVEVGGALAGKTVIHCAVGEGYVIAITSDNKAYSLGENNYGQLGLGNTNDQYTPVEITSVSNVIDAAAGEEHTMLLTRDGSIFTCGTNIRGELGNGTRDIVTSYDPENPESMIPTIVPHPDFNRITFPAGVSVKSISAGSGTSAALGTNAKVYKWGNSTLSPTEVSGLHDISKISMGIYNVTSINYAGEVFTNTTQVVGVGGTGYLTLGELGAVSESHNVTGNYNVLEQSGDTIYSVDITWGSLEFTYTDSDLGTWNPDTLQYINYTAGQWSCAENTNKITVVNKSNTAITAELSFNASIAGITGNFFTATTGGTVITRGEMSIESAAPVSPATVGTAKTAEAYLQITAGSLTAGQTDVTIGTITVRVN